MAAGRRALIAGNWKMNGLRADGLALARAIADRAGEFDCELLICPPTTLIASVAEAISAKPVSVGGQDCHYEDAGAYTGDVSATMLRDAGCSYVIVGHSERRTDHLESDEEVRAKAEAAHDAGLTAIVCVGETEEQRNSGFTIGTISTQLEGSVPPDASAGNTVIAYEPVWAIGTGRTPTPEEAQDVHDHIRTYLRVVLGQEAAAAIRILYGGSMKPGNAGSLLAQPDIDGGLIGGASLKAEDFLGIATAAG